MHTSLEFLLGLLDHMELPCVAAEDLDGEHRAALRTWQEMGFLCDAPGVNPVTGCPHCGEGVPYLLGERYRCNRCFSSVDGRHLLLWPMDREAFLRWLAGHWKLKGGVRQVEDRLWQLGTWEAEDGLFECFYRRAGSLMELGRARLSAYRRAIVFYGLTPPPDAERFGSCCVSLFELLHLQDSLTVTDLRPLVRARGNVRFDAHSGALWVGDAVLGEVPVGSKEFFFLRCLASHLDHFVPYADLKHEVLRQSGSSDATEEATFCQGLKNRIKKKWIPKIDLLLVTNNKADGYRLRGFAEL